MIIDNFKIKIMAKITAPQNVKLSEIVIGSYTLDGVLKFIHNQVTTCIMEISLQNQSSSPDLTDIDSPLHDVLKMIENAQKTDLGEKYIPYEYHQHDLQLSALNTDIVDTVRVELKRPHNGWIEVVGIRQPNGDIATPSFKIYPKDSILRTIQYVDNISADYNVPTYRVVTIYYPGNNKHNFGKTECYGDLQDCIKFINNYRIDPKPSTLHKSKTE